MLPVGIDHLVQLVTHACDVMAQGRAAANDGDFYSEAQSYWSLVVAARGSIWLIAPPPPEHAVWTSAVVGDDFVVAPSKQALLEWAAAGGCHLSGRSEPALVIRLDTPLHPKDYPLTMKDLVTFIEQHGAAAELVAAMSRWRARRELPVVLAFRHESEDVCLGATFLAPRQVKLPGARHNGLRGFRYGTKGRKSARLVALGMVPMRFPHLRVTPIYRSFLHNRTAGSLAGSLADFHVAVAGCGAIGGQLAVQLVQAGVGRLTLLDGDVMTWQNVGRHVLDSSAVGQFKVKALERAIRRRFPDAKVTGIPMSWQAYLRDNGDALAKADLMISATGDAAANLHLDALAAEGNAPAVVYAWIEPFGVAAHAVLCQPGGRGLRDISDAAGRLLEPVADIASAPKLPREPACGAFYQPYSSLSALPSVALVGQLALDALAGRVSTSVHRVWVGGPDEFADNGLSLHPAWLPRLNSLGYNRRFDFVV